MVSRLIIPDILSSHQVVKVVEVVQFQMMTLQKGHIVQNSQTAVEAAKREKNPKGRIPTAVMDLRET